MMTTNSGLVPLLDETGRFPDSFAPPSVEANMQAAQAAQAQAEEAAQNAAGSATGAQGAAGDSAASAQAAQAARENATSAAQAASGSASQASSSATDARGSATAAASSASSASQSAALAESHKNSAATSKDQAAASATLASTKALAASDSATNAQASALATEQAKEQGSQLLVQKGNVSGTLDLSTVTTNQIVHITRVGNITITLPMSPIVGQTITLVMKKDATNTAYAFALKNVTTAYGVSITPSNAANALDEIMCFYDGVRWKARVSGLSDAIPTSWVVS